MIQCKCGRELVGTGKFIDENESFDWQLCTEQEITASQALQPNIINKIDLPEEKMFEYFSSAFELLTKARFLKWRLIKLFKEKYDLPDDFDIINDEFVIHKEC